MDRPILVIGSLNADLVIKTSRCPQAGETFHGESFSTHSGGKGANQACACGKLNNTTRPVKMVGRVGSDQFGPMLISSLQQYNVDTSLIATVDNVSTGVAMIMVETSANGQNRICLSIGANAHFTVSEMDKLQDEIKSAAMVILQHEIPRDAVIRALEIAHSNHTPTLLNPAPADPGFPRSALANVDYFVPNETELALFLGLPAPDSLDTVKAYMSKLMDSHQPCFNKALVVTVGSQGALVASRDDPTVVHVPAQKVTAVDSTAAGDSFIGGFVTSLLNNNSVVDAVRFGILVAGIAVTREGAQPSIPSLDEIPQS